MKHLAYGMGIQLMFLTVFSSLAIGHAASVSAVVYIKFVFYLLACVDFVIVPILGIMAIGAMISDKKETTNFAAMTVGLFLGMMAYFVIVFLFKTMIP